MTTQSRRSRAESRNGMKEDVYVCTDDAQWVGTSGRLGQRWAERAG